MKVERRDDDSKTVDLTLEPKEFDTLERTLLDTKSPFCPIPLSGNSVRLFQDNNKNWIWVWVEGCDQDNNPVNNISVDMAAEPFIWDCVLGKSTG